MLHKVHEEDSKLHKEKKAALLDRLFEIYSSDDS